MSTPARAFGLKTHLWIAQQVLDDLARDCKITLRSKRVAIEPALCESLRRNRGAYLAGAIGPDTFPDLRVGQGAVHPGVPGSWQTSDWLRHLYHDAPDGAQLAFAAGYLAHANGDVFAHTPSNLKPLWWATGPDQGNRCVRAIAFQRGLIPYGSSEVNPSILAILPFSKPNSSTTCCVRG